MTGLRPGACCALVALLLIALPSSAHALTFTVNSTDDATDATTTDSQCATAAPVRCTLRAAIQQSNSSQATGQRDEIILPAAAQPYDLTLPGIDDTSAGGDLDIIDPVLIRGDGAATTIVRQTLTDRVIDVQQNQVSGAVTELVGVGITGGDLAGIRANTTSTKLVITDSAIFGNTNTGPGGGIDAEQTASGVPAAISGTTISGNSAPNGGGIWAADGAVLTLENSTISGNTATAAGGGGGIATRFANGSPQGTVTLTNGTVTANVAPNGAGGGFNNTGTITVMNTIVSGNTGGNCAGDPVNAQKNNLENGTSCGFNRNGDPLLGPLADNGGETQTHAIPAGSAAVNFGSGCPPPSTDQRGVSRPQGAACDIGSFEFVPSKTVPSVPDCSPTGTIELTMAPPAGETPVAFKYKVDGGPTQTAATSDTTEPITLPEGSFQLEYWSQTSAGEEPQPNHLFDTALVDMTAPTLSVASDQSQDRYVITRNASVTVQAGDALSGLTVDPTAQGEAVTTSSRGQKTVQWTAQDLCENQTTRQFDYTVLGPGLGERAVIEPLGDGVQIDLPGTGARASQKGSDFQPVTQPREIPIGTRVNATAGQARITSSKSTTETDIQDGAFSEGIFEVLQSRSASNGLTTLELKGSNFRNCEAAGGGANAARLSKQARRRLRGNATGNFRTRGRHSAATVRGTKWTVTDRCDGTLTKVSRGTVAVRDFRLARTITLTRGESYLAQAEPDPPVLGKTVNVEPVKGKVFVKLPRGLNSARASQKGATFVPLTEARSIPVKSILDTRKGTVALRTARNRKGTIQSGRFAAGIFQVLQSRKRSEKGLTDVVLKGNAARFNRCGRGKGSSASAHTSLSRRAIRRLRARARGRYRTRGRHSAATVRGTVWNMTDSCAGTLTTVKRGKVTVRDFRKRKTVVLTRGKSYLARPR